MVRFPVCHFCVRPEADGGLGGTLHPGVTVDYRPPPAPILPEVQAEP